MSNATVSIAKAPPASGRLYYRHSLPVRIMHWINVVALTILFMSGLMIFNAHPRLYWGKSSYTGRPPILEIGARESPESGAVGYTKILGREFNTTGVLGYANGTFVAENEGALRKAMDAAEVLLRVDLGMLGTQQATAWGCDLTDDYVHINADYTT